MQKYLTLFISIFIIYQLFYQNFGKIDFAKAKEGIFTNSEPHEVKLEGSWFEKKASQIVINLSKTPEGQRFLEKLIQPAQVTSSDYNGIVRADSINLLQNWLNFKIIKEGEGRKAICGSKVEIIYKIIDENGSILEESKPTFSIGFSKNIHLDNIVAGMKVGEVREAMIAIDSGPTPSKMSKVSVELIKLITKVPAEIKTLRVFEDVIGFTRPVMCGDKLEIGYKITNVDSKVLSESKLFNIQLGHEDTPVAFSEGLFNKNSLGTKTLIVQGALIKNSLSKTLKTFKDFLKNDELYIIDIIINNKS